MIAMSQGGNSLETRLSFSMVISVRSYELKNKYFICQSILANSPRSYVHNNWIELTLSSRSVPPPLSQLPLLLPDNPKM